MHYDGYELVHFNFAIGRHPLDHPDMAGFTAQLDAVNRRAATSPGFVWTPTDGEAGDADATFGSPLILANMSTWRSLEDLRRFTYEGQHGTSLRRRREWFEAPRGPAYVLWWAPVGRRPNWDEAKRRLVRLAAQGPTPEAFTFGQAFSPQGERISTAVPVAEHSVSPFEHIPARILLFYLLFVLMVSSLPFVLTWATVVTPPLSEAIATLLFSAFLLGPLTLGVRRAGLRGSFGRWLSVLNRCGSRFWRCRWSGWVWSRPTRSGCRCHIYSQP